MAFGQDKTNANNPDMLTHISRKGIYQIKYNKKHWQKEEGETKWDADFHDTYNLLAAYFIEYDYYLAEKDLKATIKEQFKDLGKMKDLKLYDKKINGMKVHYFELNLEYQGFWYAYQGFIYNGKGGSMEVHFGVQQEGLKQYQEYIDEFCNGITIIE
ncbi:hypothetical protein E4635_03345 [Flavobacterium humi]|uniref:Uncharacterized protein n=2 Tax=Flavobacterium humi TaxID=2562683 RepID=A0A4Z0LBP3_9FLAO|nr:hypothetical protein E4635_03345 [Flavobacterium humi]